MWRHAMRPCIAGLRWLAGGQEQRRVGYHPDPRVFGVPIVEPSASGKRREPTRASAMEAGDGRGTEEEKEVQVMSEVHLGCPPGFSGLYVSRFSFSSRPLGPPSDSGIGGGGGGCEFVAATSSSCASTDFVAVDEDGDLVLDRRRRNRDRRCDNHVLTVQHGITSSLKSVGLQVWKAALLLTDLYYTKALHRLSLMVLLP
ncbi:hypothetical protein GUJ93_ZPchr0012g21880 [Zizania palustris]|uniref:Uncharacterized protein n=1 Tax=Zizania palustris TaxID=103762 RepID=A0A8J5WPG5_ZIZPA|nr:hypothetical protein GUJ93_ZPchr0012g21880 [Zizania palustris]